jgi:FkbM family methyltransferase
LANDIHTLIVPEICWESNWNRLFDIQVQVTKLTICSIPMIEIVIKEEILNHNRLSSTLYCTREAEKVLNGSGVNNGIFLGYGFGLPLSLTRLEDKLIRLAQQPKIRFLHVAGHNPLIRKNTNQVIKAFSKALTLRDDIELTITSMDPVSTYYPGQLPSGITILDYSLSRNKILDLYEEHDVSIQVSSSEGLGLGFYESISRGTPVLSLDCPPHNEIVLEGETGWLIPVRSMNSTDNKRAIVKAWRFNTTDLVSRIISLDREEIDRVTVSSRVIYKTRFDEVALLTRFLQALPRLGMPASLNQSEVDLVAAPITVSVKFLLKRVLLKMLRAAYQLTKPVTRRIAFKLRLMMIEATADLLEATADLRHDVHESHAALEEIRREVEFIKHRTATYAGQGAVLTYLKDESPIFVNTGDLGCPSPIINGGIWEPENLSVLYSFVTSNTVFLDIGANIGYFTIAIGNRLKRGGKVFAIEPHPSLTNLIERSVQLNSLEAVVKIFQCAVSDQEGKLDLFYPDDHLGQGSSSRNKNKQGRSFSAQAHRLDDLLPQDVVVDLIKIDVEGQELSVLRGMQKLLRRSPNVKVLLEK